MANDHNPMNLENLPDYLKSMKENGGSQGSPVVNTGQIIVEAPSYNWITKLALTSALGLFLLVGSMAVYNATATQNITIVVDINGDAGSLAKIVEDSGAKVLSVEQKDNSTYEVKLTTRKSRKSLLDFLLNNKDVKKVE